MAKPRPIDRKATDLSKDEIAVELIKQLDGIPIHDAKAALSHAAELLETTQIVSSKKLGF